MKIPGEKLYTLQLRTSRLLKRNVTLEVFILFFYYFKTLYVLLNILIENELNFFSLGYSKEESVFPYLSVLETETLVNLLLQVRQGLFNYYYNYHYLKIQIKFSFKREVRAWWTLYN